MDICTQRKQTGKLKYTDLSDTISERDEAMAYYTMLIKEARGQPPQKKAETCHSADPGETVQLVPGHDKGHKINSRVLETCWPLHSVLIV